MKGLQKKEAIFTAIAVLLFSALTDIASFMAGLLILRNPLNKLYLYKEISAEKDLETAYQNYLNKRDPTLGWPSPTQFGGGDFNELGARRTTVFNPPHPSQSCISLYGDSFTYSDEVEHAYAWGNILSQRQNCQVNNFGVGGYGTDQAYLRYLNNKNDRSPIVILGIYSENIRRNVNQFRGFYRPGTGNKFGFKPRFITKDSGLKLVPIPDIPVEELEAFSAQPKRYLKHDFYIPGGMLRTRFQFPYSISLLKACWKMQRRDRIFPVSRYYTRHHPSGGLQVTIEIVKQFQETALKRNQHPVVLFIPSSKALKKYQATGQWEHQILRDELDKIDEISFWDSSEKFIDYLGNRSPNQLYLGERGHSHFNQLGYAVLAEVAHEYLLEENLLNEWIN